MGLAGEWEEISIFRCKFAPGGNYILSYSMQERQDSSVLARHSNSAANYSPSRASMPRPIVHSEGANVG